MPANHWLDNPVRSATARQTDSDFDMDVPSVKRLDRITAQV
ncbi:MAG: hypothetical protein AB2705_15875 [Candidatus Thiodiazotropha sp.]